MINKSTLLYGLFTLNQTSHTVYLELKIWNIEDQLYLK